MKLFIYGSGGIGCELIDIVNRVCRTGCKWSEFHFVDDVRKEEEYYGVKVFRFEEMLAESSGDYECIIAQGEPRNRRLLYEKLQAHSVRLATLIDPSAVVSATAKVGAGCIVGPNSFVSSHTELADNVMLEIQTIVGHDIRVGKHSVVSSCTVLGGGTSIGEESFIGLNCTIKEGTRIGQRCIIGMHSAVFGDVQDGLIALGSPARAVRRNEGGDIFKH